MIYENWCYSDVEQNIEINEHTYLSEVFYCSVTIYIYAHVEIRCIFIHKKILEESNGCLFINPIYFLLFLSSQIRVANKSQG